MENRGPAVRAGGTIAPNRFVTIDITADNQAVQVTTTAQPILGVAQEGMKLAPGSGGANVAVAANANDQIDVRCSGRVALVEAGGAVTRGDKLVSDTSGRAVTMTSGSPSTQYMGGLALESASGAGVKFRMWVLPQQTYF